MPNRNTQANSATAIGRRQFLTGLGAGAVGVMAARSEQAPAKTSGKPNIISIVADDLGYADVGYQGCKDIPTPNIDSIAKSGVQFTDGYVSCPVCSPTRAGLMTGRYQQRFGHEFNPGPPLRADPNFGLPVDETTMADMLRENGYATGIVGKWHLGLQPRFHPMRRGFQEFFGFLHGAHNYLDAKADADNPILRGTDPVDEKEYLTDAFTREAVSFIDRHQREPFFLYLPYNAVHTPMQATRKYLDRFASIQNPARRTFAAMLRAMDDGIGAVLSKLRECGIEENTLVLFISDNGGPTKGNTSLNTPLNGTKGMVLEGGVRVPFAMQWKRGLKGGQVCRRPVIALDIFPTAAAIAGNTKPPKSGATLDGVNLLPYLTAERDGAPHESLFWRFGANAAVRSGDWKLVRQESQPDRLYNLARDIGETNDLASSEPRKAKELVALYDAWNAKNIAPLWKTAARPRKKAAKKKVKKEAR